MIAGIVTDSIVPIEPLPGALALSLFGAAALIRRIRLRASVPLAFAVAVCAGVIVHHRAFHTVPEDDVVTFAPPERALARLVGTVVGQPKVYSRSYPPFDAWSFEHERMSFILEVDSVETNRGFRSASGDVRVTVGQPALAVREGVRVEAFGWLYRTRGPRNPGEFDWALFNARRGVRANLSCEAAEGIRVLERPSDHTPWSVARLRHRSRQMLLDDRVNTGGSHVTLLDALVLGRRSGIERDIEEAFIRTGCIHYLAVSGSHVSMLAAAVWFAARLADLNRSARSAAVMIVVGIYAVIADACPSIMRAAIMIFTFCLAPLTYRRASSLNSLLLAAFIILMVDPTSLFDIGFQLSFISVAGIICIDPAVSSCFAGALRRLRRSSPILEAGNAAFGRLAEMRPGRHPLVHQVAKAISSAASVSLTAWLVSLPMVAAHFERVCPWGWVDSLLAFPLVFVVMMLGFARLGADLIVPFGAAAIDSPLEGATRLLTEMLGLLGQVPATIVQVPAPPWWWCACFYISLGSLVTWRRGWHRGRSSGVCFAALAAATVVWSTTYRPPSGLRVTQLAVGRGTSTVIECPSGEVWIYDAGTSAAFDPGARIIMPYLASRGIHRLDGIIISHPNLDHFGGVPSLISSLECGPVYISRHFERLSQTGEPGHVLLAELARRDHPVRIIDSGARLTMGDGVEAEVLWPTPQAQGLIEANESSIVIRVRHREHAVLLTGDITRSAQQWLLDNTDVSADVLVLPHHGAVVANTAAFLGAVGPKYMIRSSFVENADSPQLARLTGGARLYNTADVGAVEVLIDELGVHVSGFAGSP